MNHDDNMDDTSSTEKYSEDSTKNNKGVQAGKRSGNSSLNYSHHANAWQENAKMMKPKLSENSSKNKKDKKKGGSSTFKI